MSELYFIFMHVNVTDYCCLCVCNFVSTVRFRFKHHAEYLVAGSCLLLREDRTRGVGVVTNVFH